MVDYTVAAEFTLKDNVSRVLGDILERMDRVTRSFAEFQTSLDKITGTGLNKLVRNLEKLDQVRWPTQLTEGAEQFDRLMGEADGRLAAMAGHAREISAALRDVRLPAGPLSGEAPGGGGGGHSRHQIGDPVMQGIAGGAVLEVLGRSFEDNARVEQTYRAMQADQRLAGDSPAMRQIRDQAAGQMDRYRTLTPLDIAKNAGEAYTVGGGDMREQAGIADMLDRAEQNLILRGKSPEDAQRQATAVLRGLDVGNRFFNRQTGQFDQTRANTEMDRVQALIAASNGLMQGQQFLSFEKSAGTAGQSLSLEGEARLAHLIDINPSRSGTALRSFEQLFGSGGVKMTDKNRAYWMSQGIIKNGKTVDADLLRSDPLLWMQQHLSNQTVDQIDAHSQRQNVGTLINEVRGSQGNINRQAAAVARSDANANSANLLSGPQGGLLQFEAGLDRFRVTLGKFEEGPGVKILTMLTDGLDRLTKIMSAHPEASENLLKLAAALAAFAVVRGAASLLGIGEGVSAMARGLALFGKGAQAGTALEALSATAGAGSLFGLAGAIVALGAAVVALPPIMKYLLGDPSQNTHPNTDARGHAYSGRPAAPGTAYDGPKGGGGELFTGFMNYLHQQWQLSQHPQSSNARGLAQHTAYTGGGDHPQPINISLTMDGHTVARLVTERQVQSMRPSTQQGMNDPDYSMMPMPAGLRAI